MLRWLRKYNVYILVAVCALLAVAFLIQGTVSVFVPGPRDQPIGKIGERELTVGDRNVAASELTLLSQIPVRGTPGLLAAFAAQDPTEWLLLKEGARRAGIEGSRVEMRQLLQLTGLADEDALARFASRQGVARAGVRGALRSWAQVQTYKELVLGMAHLRPEERLQKLQQAAMLMRFGALSRRAAERATLGRPRISEPLLRRFLHDQYARARVTLARIPADVAITGVDEPSEERVRELFQRYRDDLPGKGDPYGFGYRLPDRVRLSYLAVDFDKLEKAVRDEVGYADALAFYEDHPDRFRREAPDSETGATQPATAATQPATQAGDGAPPVKPFDAVREEAFTTLRRRKARALGARMIKAARGELLEDAHGLERAKGYRRIPSDWTPRPLEDVAAELADRFGVKPRVEHPEAWLTREELGARPGIGDARLPDRLADGAGIVDYAFSARAFDPAPDQPVVALQLQAKLPSRPLKDEAGNRYLFRIREAAPARAPESLAEVEQRVRRDAKQLAAYQALKKRSDRWLARLRRAGVAGVAADAGTSPARPSPFPRRRVTRGGAMETPEIPQVGKSPAFVDAVFELVRSATEGGQIVADPAERYAVVPVDRKLSLVAFHLEGYEPVTRSRFERLASSRFLPIWLEQTLAVGEETDPFSIASLSERIGFERVR